MKLILFMTFIFFIFPACLQAYQVGGKAKPNFGNTAAQEKQEESTGAKAQQTRSFTSYSSRQNWNKKVETQTVQTSPAGSNVSHFQTVQSAQAEESAADAQPVAAAQATKGSADKSGGKPVNAAKPAPAAPAVAATQASSQTAAGAGDMAQAAAAMQQVQNMMNMVNQMGGNAAPAGGKPAAANTATSSAGMNIPGMSSFKFPTSQGASSSPKK